jgi:hypothetical protein
MSFRPLKSFFPTADELLRQDLPTLGNVLLTHLKSYEGLNTVYQHAGLNRRYFRAMLENQNVGLGPLPKEPEYGLRQPDVTKRMMEAWNWLERQGLLIHNDEQVGDWFTISSDGEKHLPQKTSTAQTSSNSALSESSRRAPRAFISYSWDGPEHQRWVAKFAERLQGESGVETTFDQWHLHPGHDKLHFMEQAVANSDFVIVVCTPAYAERANQRKGGVGYESMVITAELAERILTNKFIPVLRSGSWSSSMPVYLKSRLGVDLSDEPFRGDQYEKLVRALHGEPIQPPPLSRKPDFTRSNQPAANSVVATNEETARFRSPDKALGVFWNTLPFVERPEYEVFLQKGPAMWLRLMPHSVSTKEWSHDELLKCARRPTIPLQPLLWSNLQYLRAEDGVGVYATVDNLKQETETRSVAFAFTKGEVWCVDVAVLQISGRNNLYFLDIARTLVQRLRGCGEFLTCLGIEPPYNWIAGLEGIKGWRLNLPAPPGRVSTSPGDTCLSFFDQLFRKCSATIPAHIEEDIRAARNF